MIRRLVVVERTTITQRPPPVEQRSIFRMVLSFLLWWVLSYILILALNSWLQLSNAAILVGAVVLGLLMAAWWPMRSAWLSVPSFSLFGWNMTGHFRSLRWYEWPMHLFALVMLGFIAFVAIMAVITGIKHIL